MDTNTQIGPWERFTIEEVPGLNGVFVLKIYHGTYICAWEGGEGSRVDSTNTQTGPWERFTIEEVPGLGVFVLKTYHGTYIRAWKGGEGSRVDTNMHIGDWEKFRFEYV